jgi:hypothetical protein
VNANLRLAGQFGLAAAITLTLAVIAGVCCEHMASAAPPAPHPRKLVSPTSLPMLLLLGVSTLLLIAGICECVAGMMENVWNRAREQKIAEPDAAVGGGRAPRENSGAPDPPPLS